MGFLPGLSNHPPKPPIEQWKKGTNGCLGFFGGWKITSATPDFQWDVFVGFRKKVGYYTMFQKILSLRIMDPPKKSGLNLYDAGFCDLQTTRFDISMDSSGSYMGDCFISHAKDGLNSNPKQGAPFGFQEKNGIHIFQFVISVIVWFQFEGACRILQILGPFCKDFCRRHGSWNVWCHDIQMDQRTILMIQWLAILRF